MCEGKENPEEGRSADKDSDSGDSQEPLITDEIPPETACPPCPPCATCPIPRSSYCTVAILCFINLINYMDRFTLAGILTDITNHFNLTDDKGGLLQTVFVISYMIFAPLFGYLGDRYSRTIIMSIGIALWCCTTLIGSFMDDFGWFVFFRALVGIGEASYSTIAPTIISDLFVKDVRSKVLAVFYFAIPVGSGLGYIVGSEVASATGNWKWGLRVTPVLGAIAIVLMLWCLREPKRGEAEGSSHLVPSSYCQDIKSLFVNRSFMWSTLGFTCVTFVAGALSWWGPHFIYLGIKLQQGGENMTYNSVSLIFGIITMLSGLLGVPLGVYIGEKFIHKKPNIHPLVCGYGLIISALLLGPALWMVDKYPLWMVFTLMFFGEVALNLNWAIVADMLLYVVIPTRRSTAEAFQILISHTFGDAISPYLIGIISEMLKGALMAPQLVSLTYSPPTNVTAHSTLDDDAMKFKTLQYALFTTNFIEVLGGVFFFCTALYIVKDKLKVEKQVEGTPRPQETMGMPEEEAAQTLPV